MSTIILTYAQSISPGIVETDFSKTMTGDEDGAKKFYQSLSCLQASDVAASVVHVITAPPHVEVKTFAFKKIYFQIVYMIFLTPE